MPRNRPRPLGRSTPAKSRYHRLPLSLERLEYRDVPAYAFAGGVADTTLDLTDAAGNLASGATVAIAPSQSNPTAAISLGADRFNFYGTEYDTVHVSYNGLLTFGTANNLAGNANLGTTLSLGQAAIAPLWDQWFSTTSFQSKGVIAKLEAGNRLIVQWDRMEDDIGTDDITFQAILSLNSGITPGDIKFNYLDTDTGNANSADGKAATVGVKEKNPGPSQPAELFTQVSHNALNANVASNKSITLTWDNTAPENLALTPSSMLINENDSILLGGSFTDPDVIDTHTITLNWGDGSPDTVLTPAKGVYSFSNVSHKYLDNPTGQPTGKYTITATFTDSQGESSVKTAQIQVNNVTPTVTVGADKTINEGDTFTRTGSFADPGTLDGPFVAEVDYGDGAGKQLLTLTGTTFDLNHTYADQGTYTVTVYVRDKDAATGSSSLTITVNNVLPTVTLDGGVGSPTVAEGTALALPTIATYTDPGLAANEIASWSINWGDGTTVTTPNPATNGTIGGTHTYADNGTYTVTVSVLDDVGPVVTKSFLVTVNNVAPTVTLDAALATTQTVSEGKTITINDLATFTDPAFNNPANPSGATVETFTYTVNWGDGTTSTVGSPTITQAGSAGTATAGKFGASHIYADDGTYTVTVTVTDDDGGVSTAKTFNIQVNNDNPAITSPATNRAVNEGAVLSIPTLATFTDYGFTNPSNPLQAGGSKETFTYSINWGDGTSADTGAVLNVTQGSAGVLTTGAVENVSHVFADDGLYTVTFSITDDNGGTVSQQFQVTVGNVAPTVAVIGNQTVAEGNKLSLPNIATFFDPGFNNPANPNGASVETFTYSINWGDGTAADAGPVTAVLQGSAGTPTTGAVNDVSHTFADDGTYTVTVTITDDNGGATSKSFTVTVNNVAPTITGIAGPQTVDEGTQLTIPTIVSFADPGFNNPANPNGASVESFTYSINWGDGTANDGGAVTNVTNGGVGVSTTGLVQNVAHTYADNGTYAVTVTITDDNGGTTAQTFQVTVDNVAPTVAATTNKTVNEGAVLNIPNVVTFTDPGFNNPLDPNGATVESFTFSINWGDGTNPDAGAVPAGNVVNGGVGVLTTGFLNGSHTYADDGLYTVSVTITDDNSGATTKTFQVTVNNVAPAVSIVGNKAVTEGAVLSIPNVVTFTDPGFNNPANPNGASVESFTYSINWGDGTAADAGPVTNVVNGGVGVLTTGALDGSHTYADDGTYTVTVTITDDNGGATSKTFQVTVNNVAPTVAIAADKTITEGGYLNVPSLVTFTDPGFDNPANPNGASVETFTYSINWGDGTAVETGSVPNVTPGSVGVPTSGFLDGAHTYADDGVYTVSVTITDDNGGATTKTLQVTVNNVAPTVAIVGNKAVAEGTQLTVPSVVTFTDPGFDNPANPLGATVETFTYSVNWGDGTNPDTGSVPNVTVGGVGVPTSGFLDAAHTYADDGVYTVSVTITDDNGGATTKSFQVTVNNVAPTVGIVANKTTTEGGLLSVPNIVTFTDPGFNNPANPNGASVESFTYTINWGDGTSLETGTVPNVTNGGVGVPTAGFLNGSHTYADDGVYTVTVTIADDNAGVTAKSFTVTVNNVAPTVAVAGNKTVTEGGSLVIPSIVTFTDPGFDNPLNPNGASVESFTYTINWGDGTVQTGPVAGVTTGGVGVATTGFLDGGHTYADDGVYTVSVSITDDNGGATTKTLQVTVNNVAPTVAIVGNKAVAEGSLLTVPNIVTFTDPGFNNPANPNGATVETFTYAINWGDGTAVETGPVANVTNGGVGVLTTGSLDGSHAYADDGTYTVSVTITDDNGGATTKSFQVLVNNTAPVVTVAGDQTIAEGAALNFAKIATWTDAGFTNAANPNQQPGGSKEAFTYSINWGDGSANDSGPAANVTQGSAGVLTQAFQSASHVYADNGTYTVTVTVTDDDGAAVSRSFAVAVTNAAPTLTKVATDTTLPEGSLLALPVLATFADPGFDNPANPNGASVESFTYTINWGDGSSETKSVANFATGSPGTASAGSFGGSHTYADNGTYTVTAVVRDDDTGLSNTVSFAVTVTNVAPTLNVAAAQAVVEGSVLNLAPVATFSDPGFNNAGGTPATAETFTYVVNWGDGSANEAGTATLTQAGFPGSATLGTVAANHVYADDGTYTVTVTVTDDDGGATTRTFTVTVANAAPVLAVVAPQTFAEGQTFNLATVGTLSDAGFDNAANPNGASLEAFTFTINWGDGTAVTTGTASITQAGSAGVPTLAAFGGGHTYDRVGTFTVVVRATDDNGGFDERAFPITVTNVAPTLTLGTGNLVTTEGTTVSLPTLGTFTDPGFSLSETYSYRVEWGDGAVSTGAAPVTKLGAIGVLTKGGFGESHAYGDNGLYPVRVVLSDSNGGTSEATFQIQVGNVAPTLTLAVPAVVTVAEGAQLSLPTLATFSDPGFGVGETFTYSVNWGDGTTSGGKASLFQVGGPDQPALGKFGELHTFAKNGTYPVTVTLADKDGAAVTQSFTVEAVNVAPTNLIYSLSPTPVLEGQTIELSGSFTDPGLFDPHTVTVDWGDGSAPAVFTLLPGVTFFSTRNVGGNFLTHTYAQNSGPGGYPLTVTVADDAGLFTVEPTATVVQNVAPTVTIMTPQKVTKDVRFVVTSDVSDPGVLDKLTYSWKVFDPAGQLVFQTATQNLEYTAPTTGKHQVSLTVSDEDGGSTTRAATIRVQNAEIFVIAADARGGPRVAIFDAKTQTRVTDFFAYEETYRGGVRVAVGDVRGDGSADIVTATGKGGGPRVRVIDSQTFENVADFFVYEETYRGGMFLAVGDVDGDGFDDIVTAPDKGGGPRVKVTSGRTFQPIFDDFVFDPALRNGVRIGVNDLNGDGFADIVAGSGPGVSARVKAIDVKNNKVLYDSLAYTAAFTGGIFLAAGDVEGDGRSEIIVAAGPGGGPHVKALDVATGNTVAEFFAYEPSFRGGVRVAAFDYDGDGRTDVLTGPGPGGGPAHRIWKPFTNEILESFFSFEETFLGGVFVGAGD
jgi:PKD repeat protein